MQTDTTENIYSVMPILKGPHTNERYVPKYTGLMDVYSAGLQEYFGRGTKLCAHGNIYSTYIAIDKRREGVTQ